MERNRKIVTQDGASPDWPQVLAGYRLLLALVDGDQSQVWTAAAEFVARGGSKDVAEKARAMAVPPKAAS